MAHRYLLVLQRLMVDRDAERRSNLVLTCITLPDIPAVIKQRSKAAGSLKVFLNPLGHFHHVGFVSRERNHGNLYRR